MNTDLAKQLTENVRAFYETQGAWFATTRDKVMPEQAFVAEYIRDGMTVVDVGAGNGRFAKLLPEGVEYVGIEPSEALRGGRGASAGALPQLDLPDSISDVTVCLAVLHHVPTDKMRRASVAELIRITKPGGIILATSWLRNPHHTRMQWVEGGETGDCWMPWTAPDGQISQRFVHFMQNDEWQKLWTHAALDIVHIGMHGKNVWTEDEMSALNWRVIVRKK